MLISGDRHSVIESVTIAALIHANHPCGIMMIRHVNVIKNFVVSRNIIYKFASAKTK